MAETIVKMTKKDWYEVIRGIVADADVEQKAEMLDFIDAQVEQLTKKAEKAAKTEKSKVTKSVKTDEKATKVAVAKKPQTGRSAQRGV